ncbi:cupin domain-containing protein [Robertkochia marina]|uniref:Cupin domain-containing protein n=1 Tax=Robertkochia marina TaxID=1227945 RepID=A0A4S3M351_9FLAO|nr:cupin domain-containing protein [Robertkochia marina]THD69145.1 cupin domain-containing protein [Robertkochia marina]TRZ47596.1 cupin domain-containing protein [Robertkochia marina]
MKTIAFLLFSIIAITGYSQDSDYSVASYKDEGTKAPNTHYIGEAWLNRLTEESDHLGYEITKATFKANSTLDWHQHSSPQVIIVVEGEGYYQERGKEPIRMKAGDVIKCPENTEHWHASSKESDVTYLALYGGTTPTTWTEVLSQEDYDRVAEQLKVD